MKLAKVKCSILSEALKDRATFSALSMYLEGISGFSRTEDGCFISKVIPFNGKPTLDFKLCLEDYFFNEPKEAEELWKFVETSTGKKNIEWTIVNIVTL